MSQKNVIVGITGGIAAYKALQVVRELTKKKHNVQVVCTPDALHFVTPLTLSVLSKNPILVEGFDQKTGMWNNHVELATWADLIIIAPLTINTLAKICSGLSDNLLTSIYFSAVCPMLFAPAMDAEMSLNSKVLENLETLKSQKNHYIIGPNKGLLASGKTGMGRMSEPNEIIELASWLMYKKPILKGKKIMITLGATVENIDPVRYISNHSSGKMGVALVQEALKLGAEVRAIVGKIETKLPPHPHLKVCTTLSAQEMYDHSIKTFEDSDLAIMCAAVADYKPAQLYEHKIKKDDQELTQIELSQNPDILKEVGEKKKTQTVVGFSLETDNFLENATKKLRNKKADMIVVNLLSKENQVFNSEKNEVYLITEKQKHHVPKAPKSEIAKEIFKFLLDEKLV